MNQPIYPTGPSGPQRRSAHTVDGAAKPAGTHRLWVWMPVWSMGLLACAPFFRRALVTRQRNDWLVTAGYLTASIVETLFIALGGDSSKPDASPNALGDVGGTLALLLMGIGAVHTSVLYRQPVSASAPMYLDGNAAAMREAAQAARRRTEARRIVENDPIMARDLKIGRPDLPRTYDDGGLIDINHASAELLVRMLSWTRAEAETVIAARDRTGGFTSLAELTAYAEIDPQRLDAIADLLVVCRL
jgi:DNA uptake protein ComE-like DNA-binding protein